MILLKQLGHVTWFSSWESHLNRLIKYKQRIHSDNTWNVVLSYSRNSVESRGVLLPSSHAPHQEATTRFRTTWTVNNNWIQPTVRGICLVFEYPKSSVQDPLWNWPDLTCIRISKLLDPTQDQRRSGGGTPPLGSWVDENFPPPFASVATV